MLRYKPGFSDRAVSALNLSDIAPNLTVRSAAFVTFGSIYLLSFTIIYILTVTDLLTR